MKFGAVLGLIVASVLFAGAGQIKGSFESGDFSGWNIQGEGWVVHAKSASDGEKSAMCIVSKGEAPGLKACARAIEKAEPGWVVQAGVDVAGKVKSGSSKASIVVMCIDAKGNTLREVKKQIVKPSVKFQKAALAEIVIPSGTVETYLMLLVEVTREAKAKEWWRFDNVVIEVK